MTLRTILLATLLFGLVCVVAPAGPPLPDQPAPQPIPLEAAPLPRAVEDTRCYRSDSELRVGAYGDEPWKIHGVEWRVKATVRRLVSTGRDVIDLKWSIKYTGRRTPLMMIGPSITNS